MIIEIKLKNNIFPILFETKKNNNNTIYLISLEQLLPLSNEPWRKELRIGVDKLVQFMKEKWLINLNNFSDLFW